MLQSMTDRKSNEQHPLEMSFIKYKSSKAKDHAGGAYLFIPTGSSQVCTMLSAATTLTLMLLTYESFLGFVILFLFIRDCVM